MGTEKDHVVGYSLNTIQPRLLLLKQSAMREKLQVLSKFHPDVLPIASCVGDEFEALKLAFIDRGQEFAAALELAVAEDLGLLSGFNRDRIRQAPPLPT
jgi:hypothetical protein